MIVADVYFIIIDYAICIFIYISINAIFHYKINELFNGFETWSYPSRWTIGFDSCLMYKKHSIPGSALTCSSLFIENTDKNQCPSYHSVHLTSPLRWLPYVSNRTTSKIKYLRAKIGHPSTYQSPPMLWKKWCSIGKVKSQSWELLQNIFSSVSELSQLPNITGTSYPVLLPLFFLLFSGTTV